AQHCADDIGGKRFPDANRMRLDQVALQLFRSTAQGVPCAGQQLVRIAAEPRGDAVQRLAAGNLALEELRGARHGLQRARVEFDRRAVGHGQQLPARERDAIQADRLHAPTSRSAATRPVSATSNCSPRRRSLTATTPRAVSSSPRITAKRIPARSAYCSCLASLRGSSWFSTLKQAARSCCESARASPSMASSISATSTSTELSAVATMTASCSW